jgi:transposase
MAYREMGMWEILDVLRRVHRGETRAAIRRATGRSRTTVRRYLREARQLGWEPSGAEPDEALATAVARRLRPGPDTDALGSVEAQLAAHQAELTKWLRPADGSRGLRLTKVHDLLARQGIGVPYSSLHRYVVAHCGFQDARRLTVRVADVAPGELAEVDFGRLGLVADPTTGRRRLVHALIVTLVHSRHQYVHVTPSQQLADLIAGLEDAWEFFGGVVRRVVLDNLKAAVTKPDRYDPIFQRTFEEYAHHRGFVIDAALPRHATGKPHVERNVPYVRDNFFRGETWLDVAHVQRDAPRWCREVAGQRVHGTTRQRPLVVFEAVEQAALHPLVAPRFDPPQWAECIVHPDHHIQFGKALYSVPTRYVGKTVWVRGDRALVRIYCESELRKTHPRQPPGGRHTDYTDYPPELAPYAMRDPERLIREAHGLGESLGRFMEQLLAPPFPWARLRQGQRLLRLANKYGRARVDAACRRALAFDLLHVGRVELIIKGGLASAAPPGTAPRSGRLVLLPSPRFLRPAGSFGPAPGPDHEEPRHGD